MPILGPIANEIVLSIANAQRRRTDPIAWQKTVTATFERFNGEVDRQLATANLTLEKQVRPKLREWSAVPECEQAATSETQLIYSSLFNRDEQTAGITPPAEPTPDPRFITVRMHESLLNQAARLLKLEGQKRTEKELTSLVEQFTGQISGQRQPPTARPEPEPKLPASPFSLEPEIVFAEQDPVRFRLADGVLTVILQLRFDIGGRTVIPTQRISIPYKGRFENDQLIIERGQIVFEPTDAENAQLRQLYEPILRTRLENSITDLTFPRSVVLPEPLNRRVGLDGPLTAEGGWLTVSLGVE